MGRTFLLWSGRVAAVLVLALSGYLFFDNSSEKIDDDQMAVVHENKQEQEKSTPENEVQNTTENTIKPEVEEQEIQPASGPEKKENSGTKTVEEEIVQPQRELLAGNTPNEGATEQIAAQRIPVEIPSKINTLSAQIETQNPQGMLASVDRYFEQLPAKEAAEEERLIGDVVREKTGLNDISLNKITKAGLKLVSSISKDNFTYETNANGEITEVNFDSRLLAFSIPTNNEE